MRMSNRFDAEALTGHARPVDVSDLPLVDIAPDAVEPLFALARASDLAELGQTDYTSSDIQRVLTSPETQAWAIVDDGEYVAAGWLANRPQRPALEAELLVRPTAPAGSAERMLDRILDAARADDRKRPVHLFAQVQFQPKLALFDARGGEVVRHFFRMQVDLPHPDATPAAWPDGVTMAPVDGSPEDFRAMYHVVDTAFQDHWQHASTPYDAWLARNTGMPAYDPTLWWLVRRDDVPVAAAIMEAHDALGYVGVLGTLREARGLGLASRLLKTAFAEFTRRGCTTSALHVDATNPTGAVRLYESVGMQVAVHYACYAIQP